MSNTQAKCLAVYFYTLFVSALSFIFFIKEFHFGIVVSSALLFVGVLAILLSEEFK